MLLAYDLGVLLLIFQVRASSKKRSKLKQSVVRYLTYDQIDLKT
jgi:hypothetical protein